MIDEYLKHRMRIRTSQLPTRQYGLTLVELMISITLGLFVVMAATAMLLSTKATYTTQDDGARLQETGRFAIEIISRAVRQAAYENWDGAEAPILNSAHLTSNLEGLDASSLKEKTAGIDTPLPSSVNGSDVLAIRFFGAGSGLHGDGTIINCAGFGVPAATSYPTADGDRGWSIFYVAVGRSGEPELYCKYRSASGDRWETEAIAHGVESFQVLYGLDTDEDGLPNHFLRATAVNALEDALIIAGANPQAQAIDKNRKTHWKRVVAVKVALLVRGLQNAKPDALTAQYDLFGKDYAEVNAAADKGTRIKESDLHKALHNRMRKIFTSTIQLRNPALRSAT